MRLNSKIFNDVEIEIKKNNKTNTYSADLSVYLYVDKEWGADADNNRSITRTIIQDVKIGNVKKLYDSEEGQEWKEVDDSKEIKEITPDLCEMAHELFILGE